MVRQELLRGLIEEAGRNDTLRNGLLGARSAEEAAQVAAKSGFTISSTEMQELRDCFHASDELSEEQLATVAGGFLAPDPDALNFLKSIANLFAW